MTPYQQGIHDHEQFMAGNHDGLNPYSTNDKEYSEWELGWLKGVDIAFEKMLREENNEGEQKTLDFPK